MPTPEPMPEKPPRDAADYELWLERKIARGLNQATDRAAMIPAEKIWRTLGLEH